ncbi:Conserved hypothetical protein [Prochlorococcus marinus str. MIT 9303]|uniref:Uncharacterized protein n=1 Tax=Prochlorococcus marinus (strain MIT 9303) TaxID=59922 RepID=A2C9I3_PROM3|nr:Conserved hypothetical protein [Prochlorococcus marinus str. MIT 9303]
MMQSGTGSSGQPENEKQITSDFVAGSPIAVN